MHGLQAFAHQLLSYCFFRDLQCVFIVFWEFQSFRVQKRCSINLNFDKDHRKVCACFAWFCYNFLFFANFFCVLLDRIDVQHTLALRRMSCHRHHWLLQQPNQHRLALHGTIFLIFAQNVCPFFVVVVVVFSWLMTIIMLIIYAKFPPI